MGLRDIFNAVATMGKGSKTQGSEGFIRACDGDLKDRVFVLYDYDGEMVILKEYGVCKWVDGFNDVGLEESKLKITKHATPVNTTIRVTVEETQKLHWWDRIAREILSTEATPRGIAFTKKSINSYLKVIEVNPICDKATTGDTGYTEDEIEQYEMSRDSDFKISNKVKEAKEFRDKVFSTVSSPIDYCIIGKFVRDGKVTGYILSTRDNRLGIVDAEEIKEHVKNKIVFKCMLSGAGITGVDGFRIRDTMVINNDSRACYMEEIRRQFGVKDNRK